MSQQELVKYAVHELMSAGINYMLTGSTVSSLQGVWRATHDIDIAVALGVHNIPAIMTAFPEPNFYVSDIAIREAIKKEKMFNVLDLVDGDILDFWMLKSTPFDRMCFSRRTLKRYLDIDVFVSTPEDTILAKLRWGDGMRNERKTIYGCASSL